jgi:hypothetical protein
MDKTTESNEKFLLSTHSGTFAVNGLKLQLSTPLGSDIQKLYSSYTTIYFWPIQNAHPITVYKCTYQTKPSKRNQELHALLFSPTFSFSV